MLIAFTSDLSLYYASQMNGANTLYMDRKMPAKLYIGSVSYGDGRQRQVTLKEGAIHWIDTDRNRWRLDGTLAGSDGKWPRLLLHSIVEAVGAGRSQSMQMTHEGRVRRKGGPGQVRRFRETKIYWIDENGVKFHKRGGWEAGEGASHKLIIETLLEIEKFDGVPVSIQPRA